MAVEYQYISKWDKTTLRQKINFWCSKFVFNLYTNKNFKRLKLNTNPLIKGTVEYDRKSSNFLLKNNLPKDKSLTPFGFSFFDIIPLEDSSKFEQKFLSLISAYKGGFLSGSPKDVSKTFEKFEESYKGTVWGHLYVNDVTKNKELDLIDFISFNYVKGPESTFIIEYHIRPSKKFIALYTTLLSMDSDEYQIIHFNNIKKIFRTHYLTNRISTHSVTTSYRINRLIQDLNYQVKSKVGSKLNLGLFQKSEHHLLPVISVFEADPIDFHKFNRAYCSALGLNDWDDFITDDNGLIFNFPSIRLSKKPYADFKIIFLKDKSALSDEAQTDTFKSTSYLSENYIKAIGPLWTSLNYIALNQTFIAYQRKSAFKYFNRNKDSLFLKAAIKLKYQILQNLLSITRVTKDYTASIFKEQLYHYGIPDAKSKRPYSNNEFKESLWKYTLSSSQNIVKDYDDIKSIFDQISEDNITRSNMKIQRILVWIAIIGVIITIYGANATYFNLVFKNFIHNLVVR